MADARELALVRRTVLDRLAGTGAAVFLFGSHAREEARRTSDIDVAVLPRAPLPRGTLAKIREALEEASIVSRVDVVDLAEAPSRLREAVLREGIRWTE